MRQAFRLSDDLRSKSTLKVAKKLIKAGRKVVLLHGIDADRQCTCGKSDCNSPGKHPITKFFPKGLNSATDDLGTIKHALRKHPKANIAITLEGLTVVDIDGPKGAKAIDRLKLENTIKVITGRGTHDYYEGENSAGTIKADQLDILTGDKHMVLVPPSLHVSGKRYTYSGSCPTTAKDVPISLSRLKLVRKKTRQIATDKPETELVITQGGRNDYFFKIACHLRRKIGDEEAIERMLATLNKGFSEEPLSSRELQSVIKSSGKYVDDAFDLFGKPEHTNPLPMEYLWYPYIPYYGVTLIAGDPGRGKSLLLAVLIAAVTKGKSWPLSSDKADKGRVLILFAEDNWQRVTLPRLIKNDVKVSNLLMMKKFRALTDENLDKLEEYVEHERPKLIVIDTISAYIGAGRDTYKQNEVGEFLGRLTEIAEKSKCAIVATGHLNKQTSEHPLYRIVGSIGFAASIRSALFLGTDPSDRTRNALAHGKANASEKGPTIIFEKIGGGREDVPLMSPIGISDASEIDVCKVETGAVGRPPSAAEDARRFILDFLKDKEVPWSVVQSNASGRNIASNGTLATVRADMAKRNEIVQMGKGKRARWKLGKAAPKDESI